MSTRGIATTAKAASVAMGVAMAVGLGAPAAFAGTNDCASVDGAARGCFHHKGDKFALADTAGDDHAVFLEYEVEQGPSGRHDFTDGSGNDITYDHNFEEGQTVRYKVCVNVQWAPDSCSVWHDAVA